MIENKKPDIKADDFKKFEKVDGETDEEDFTNFQILSKKVDILQENLDEVVQILEANNIERKKIIDSPYFDDDELYKRLENDN